MPSWRRQTSSIWNVAPRDHETQKKNAGTERERGVITATGRRRRGGCLVFQVNEKYTKNSLKTLTDLQHRNKMPGEVFFARHFVLSETAESSAFLGRLRFRAFRHAEEFAAAGAGAAAQLALRLGRSGVFRRFGLGFRTAVKILAR